MTRPRGFSLLEVLAALVLLSLVLLGVYSGIRTSSRIVRSGEARIQRLDEVRSGQQFVRRELAQALAIPFDRNDDGDGIVINGDTRRLRFVAPLPGYLGKQGPQLQTLELVRDGTHDYKLQVGFATLPPDGSASVAVGDPEVLLSGITDGHFDYRGTDDQGQPMDWADHWPDGRRLPTLARIELTLAGGISWPPLVVPVRVDATAVGAPGSLTRGLRGQVLR
jgi:general secretion pathway protein J